ncbi:MAG: hypothetical protein Q8P76_04365 [bacterium]|nr:hypothetical protein [bacterium]
MIYIVIFSILAITGLVWLFNKISPFKVCPICAGVSGTWLWLLAAMANGWLSVNSYQLPVGILMGGSVVGIAYQLEKRLPENRSPLIWKTIFIPLGFLVAYYLVLFDWMTFAIFLAIELLFVWLYFRLASHQPKNVQVEKLEKQMEKCC